MANIVITSTANTIIVDFGDYAVLENIDGKKAVYNITDISIVWLEKDDSFINVKMKDAITTPYWQISYMETTGALIVDSIDGVAPTDNVDLFNMINILRG